MAKDLSQAQPKDQKYQFGLLGCPRKLGSMIRINGLFHLLINGRFIGG